MKQVTCGREETTPLGTSTRLFMSYQIAHADICTSENMSIQLFEMCSKI